MKKPNAALEIFIFTNRYLFCYFLEYPIDPPTQDRDPFDVEILPSLNCKFKLVDGVFRVFNNDDTPFSDFVYPELKMFLDDYHLMVNMISNGPLYVYFN